MDEFEFYSKEYYFRCPYLRQHHLTTVESCLARRQKKDIYPECENCKVPLRKAILIRKVGEEEVVQPTRKVRRRRR
jgi:hypothetical protein